LQPRICDHVLVEARINPIIYSSNVNPIYVDWSQTLAGDPEGPRLGWTGAPLGR